VACGVGSVHLPLRCTLLSALIPKKFRAPKAGPVFGASRCIFARMVRPLLSLVIPVYNEQDTIPELDRRLRDLLANLPDVNDNWEVVFVEDGSKDTSRELLLQMAAREPRYRVIAFSRNFGHQFAITAGVDRAEGDSVVVMDADLQDPPSVVAEMLEQRKAGFDVVYGVRKKRKGETWFKRATASLFYRLIRSITGVSIPVDAGDFRLMSRPVVAPVRPRNGCLGWLQANGGLLQPRSALCRQYQIPIQQNVEVCTRRHYFVLHCTVTASNLAWRIFGHLRIRHWRMGNYCEGSRVWDGIGLDNDHVCRCAWVLGTVAHDGCTG